MTPTEQAIEAVARALWGAGDEMGTVEDQRDTAAALVAQITPMLTGPLQGKLDAAEADKRQAVEHEKRLARRIHMQRAQLRWLNAWMMGSLQSTRMNMLKRTLLTKRSPYVFGPDPEKLRATWEVVLRRVYGDTRTSPAPVHKAGCPGTGSHDETGGRDE